MKQGTKKQTTIDHMSVDTLYIRGDVDGVNKARERVVGDAHHRQ
jgi:hypothetical protein